MAPCSHNNMAKPPQVSEIEGLDWKEIKVENIGGVNNDKVWQLDWSGQERRYILARVVRTTRQIVFYLFLLPIPFLPPLPLSFLWNKQSLIATFVHLWSPHLLPLSFFSEQALIFGLTYAFFKKSNRTRKLSFPDWTLGISRPTLATPSLLVPLYYISKPSLIQVLLIPIAFMCLPFPSSTLFHNHSSNLGVCMEVIVCKIQCLLHNFVHKETMQRRFSS